MPSDNSRTPLDSCPLRCPPGSFAVDDVRILACTLGHRHLADRRYWIAPGKTFHQAAPLSSLFECISLGLCSQGKVGLDRAEALGVAFDRRK